MFDVFATLLPRVAEEGTLNQPIEIAQIERSLVDAMGCTEEEACHQRLIVERLLCTLCVLDDQALSQGFWRFVSFPGSLLARSVLDTLARPGNTYFPRHYWEQGAHRPTDIIEEQRGLLQELETRRLRYCQPDATARPIRVVHVAWALIRIDGRFILLHREDKTRTGVGNYVLPGGRFQPADWPGMLTTDLAGTQVIGKRLSQNVLENTLARELEEELGLRRTQHYQASHWHDVRPWRQLEGARNHQAYTEYLISIFHIELTAQGELVLYDQTTHQQCKWFSVEELASQRLPDGTTSYLDALLADFGKGFASSFAAISESRRDTRQAGESGATDFPYTHSSLLRGKTGKEKMLDIELGELERSFLLGLAWHAKGLVFEDVGLSCRYPRGWAVLDDQQAILSEAIARKLMTIECPLLEMVDARYVRINLQPHCIYLDPTVFRFELIPENGNPDVQHWRLNLSADALATPLGLTLRLSKSIPISRNTARIVQAVIDGKDPETEPQIKSGDIQKTLRDQIDQPLRAVGLRKLVRIDEGVYRLNVEQAHCSGSSPLANVD